MTIELVTEAVNLEIALNKLSAATKHGTLLKLRLQYAAEHAQLRYNRRKQALKGIPGGPVRMKV